MSQTRLPGRDSGRSEAGRARYRAPGGRPGILLKARPTVGQLVERLGAPTPDGVELYIHEDDVSGPDWLDALSRRFAAVSPPEGFTWIVEGPVWSLDGALFGLCRNDETDRELARRLIRLARMLRAPAVNIHCVDGSPDVAVLTRASDAGGSDALVRALPFLEWYVAQCRDEGIQPLIENVPPICRMRRGAFIFTPIGVSPEDLLACARAVPGLGLTLDTSHAQLAVNAFSGQHTGGPPELATALAHYRELGGVATLDAFIAPLLPFVVSAHLSNARGILDEGLPYDDGEVDLDKIVAQLATAARYLVTEPLDDDEDRPVNKRQMQRRLNVLLDRIAPAPGDGGIDAQAVPPAGTA